MTAKRKRCFRPRLEALEGRWLPSTVTNLMDAGPGSLRQAILDTPAGDTVDFDPSLSGTITLTTGGLTVDKDLTIDGPGAGVITVSGNNAWRVLDIAASASVELSGLTIANGKSPVGGGIFNSGALDLTGCTFSGNSASGSPTVISGGGICNTGMLTVNGCTLTGNSAVSGGSGNRSGNGGGIYNIGTLIVSGSTLTGNSASGTAVSSGSGSGGAIYSTGMLTLDGCT